MPPIFDIIEHWFVAPEDAVLLKKVGKGYIREIYDSKEVIETYWQDMFDRCDASHLEKHGRTEKRTVLVAVYTFGKRFDELKNQERRTADQIRPCSAEDVEYALSKAGPSGCHHCDQDPPCRGCVLAAEVEKFQAERDGVILVYREIGEHLG